jgi:chaperonin cofactor prefoldin
VTPKPPDTWSPDILKQHYDERLNRIETDLHGFPEHYALRDEMERDLEFLRLRIEKLSEDHVQRREYDEIRADQKQASGRRTAFVGALGVIVTLMAIMWGLVTNQMITHAQVTEQIKTEAPWVADRPTVESNIDQLDRRATQLEQQIAVIRQQIEFFCRTRTKAGLPGC